MAIELLSDAKVRSASAGNYPDGDGLYLQVTKSGAKSWTMRYKLADKRREMGLGGFPTFSLAEARQKARDARKLVAEGKDPIEQRRVAPVASAAVVEVKANGRTFQKVAEELIALKDERGHWKKTNGADDAYPDKSKKQWESTLAAYVYPVFGAKDCDAVTSDDVAKALSPIWTRINETARRLRGRIEDVLDYAAALKYRDQDRANAARWEGPLEYKIAGGGKQRTKAAQHHPALPREDMHSFMQQLRARPERSARLLEWTILSNVRTTEARLGRVAEVDRAARVWKIPGKRMKMKEAHRVPLSPRMLELLKDCPSEGYLFPTTSGRVVKDAPYSTAAMDAVLERMGYAGRASVHGFRSTFKDWANEETDCPDVISEMALAHRVSDEVKAAYLRGDAFQKRAALMNEWAEFCTKPYKLRLVPLKKAA